MKKSILGAALAACVITIAGCDDARRAPPIPPTVTGNLLLLTDNNELASINIEASDKLVSKESIKGLKTGDSLVGLDYSPADRQLYAIGYLGNIYTIDTTTTTATFKKVLTADAADTTAPFTAITGDKSQIAVNFDPVSGLLRLIGSNGQNLRIDVETGKTTTDTAINGADATVTAIAHTNSFSETRSTRLFDIDVKQDRLFLQSSPNDGTLGTSAALGVTATGSSGLVINGVTNEAFAVLTVNGVQQLYKINLNSIGTQTNAASLTDPENLKGKLPALGNIHAIALEQNRGITSYAFGLTSKIDAASKQKLVFFNVANPTYPQTINIDGLPNDESIVGIDFRPSTLTTGDAAVLYGLSKKGKLYIIKTTTGVATEKVALTAAADDTTLPFTALTGDSFAVDFDPLTNNLRVISNTGQNLRIDVDTGKTTTETELSGIPSAIVSASAYTNTFVGTGGSSKLFNLERSTNQLALLASPNDGILSAVGALSISLGSITAFDISGGDNGLVIAASSTDPAKPSTLYKVDLATGKATSPLISKVGDDSTPALIDIALLQVQ